ncbi:MAG TPA: hypothetical protein VK967_02005 [Methylotenera sp.]|nr:hypothetical protein [Methylotenera sp.]
MKLTVDCELNSQLLGSQHLAQLLAKAKLTQQPMPLEALVCNQYGLVSEPDYPIAAIAASADGLDVSNAYWLRADPVHLVLQRDSFSLGEPVPLQVKPEYAQPIIASLNQHFNQDGLTFLIGDSGAWYLRVVQAPGIQTTLPTIAIAKNIYQFMPQGVASAKWLAMLNEVQMLLHEHAANLARESIGEVAVNSIWLSGGGMLPSAIRSQNDVNLLVADSAFYQGLAKWADVPCQSVPDSLECLLDEAGQHSHVRLQLSELQLMDDAWWSSWWSAMLQALKNRKIQQLTLNLGFYEKTLIAEVKPLDLYKFWRSTKPLLSYLQ